MTEIGEEPAPKMKVQKLNLACQAQLDPALPVSQPLLSPLPDPDFMLCNKNGSKLVLASAPFLKLFMMPDGLSSLFSPS